MTPQLEKKVAQAIKLLQSIPTDKGDIELSYSGGKDSDVCLELCKMAGLKVRPIYKCTTIDPKGTTAHCKSKGVEVMMPNRTFFDIVAAKGAPTRRARFCCSELKEYKICDIAIQGIRKSESTRRNARYKEPVLCRVYGKKSNSAQVFLPILYWTNEDVREFIEVRGIQCHPLYYDSDGSFCVERRLGCFACPMKADCGLADLKSNIRFTKALLRNIQRFFDTRPSSRTKKIFNNSVYDVLYHDLYCKSYDEYWLKTHGLWPLDCKTFLEEQFNADLTIELNKK